MRATVAFDQARRYLTRLRVPQGQYIKTGFAVALAFLIVLQLLLGTSTTTIPNKLAVVKPGQIHNENYASLSGWQNMGFSERCIKFFEGLQAKEGADSDIQDFESISANSREFSLVPEWEDFLEAKKASAGDSFNREMEKELHKQYTDEATIDKSRSERFLSFFSNVRIYGACYVESNVFDELSDSFGIWWNDEVGTSADETNAFHLSNDFGLKYFSWLTQISPVYKKLGATTVESGVPIIEDSYEATTVGKASFLYNFRQSLNGRGIVIPVKHQKDVNDVLKLAKILRFMGITLPVQIVHDGYIKGETEAQIADAFTSPIKHTDFFTMEAVGMLPDGFDINFSPLENVWFVNIAVSIDKRYTSKIDRDINLKTMAMLFSSFEEAIMIDPNVIPMRQLFSIMDNPFFLSTGSYYFPDYRVDIDANPSENNFIKKLFPTEVDELIFSIAEPVKDNVEGLRFFKERKTTMIDSNVVVLNKKEHFLGLLLSAELQFMPIRYDHPSLKSDFLFIGPFAAGTDHLYVHEFPAAVIGKFTAEQNRKVKQSVAKEICSQHKGYFDHDSTLMFFTNGVTNCESDNFQMEEEKGYSLYNEMNKDESKIHEWNRKATSFEGAIIPLPQEFKAKNDIDEIEVGLVNYGYCSNNIWCAYDILGAQTDPRYHGDVIEFDSSTKSTLELVVNVWMKF